MSTRRPRRLRGWRDLMMVRMLVALLAAAVGWSIAATGALAASTAVKIGVVLPLSGSLATAGQAAEHGAQLAVQQANSGKLVPGITFSIVPKSDADAAGTPSGATGATEIKGLIGNGPLAGSWPRSIRPPRWPSCRWRIARRWQRSRPRRRTPA